MIYPVLIVVAANTFYNICTKSVPARANAFSMLTITYSVAALLSLILLFATSPDRNIIPEFFKNNWSALVLGFAIVALEFGYVLMFRAGWEISSASVVANISLAIVLLFVGYFLYKETISIRQIAGVAVCLLGIWLISK